MLESKESQLLELRAQKNAKERLARSQPVWIHPTRTNLDGSYMEVPKEMGVPTTRGAFNQRALRCRKNPEKYRDSPVSHLREIEGRRISSSKSDSIKEPHSKAKSIRVNSSTSEIALLLSLDLSHPRVEEKSPQSISGPTLQLASEVLSGLKRRQRQDSNFEVKQNSRGGIADYNSNIEDFFSKQKRLKDGGCCVADSATNEISIIEHSSCQP